jgi:DNA-binding response OmpR family regulator
MTWRQPKRGCVVLELEGARSRILVVDDDRAILELVCNRLDVSGYQAFNARSGEDALRRLASLRPAAMVLDLSMPQMDGFGVLERMGKEGTALTPVLVLTARHGIADVKRAISLGARDYLTKPFTNHQLLTRLSRLLRAPLPKPTVDEMLTSVEPPPG